MATAQVMQGIDTRFHVDTETAPALALRLALDWFASQDRSLLPPKSIKGSKGVWAIMRITCHGRDSEGDDKGSRAGDLSAMTEIKAWVEKLTRDASGNLVPVVKIEGATADEETAIRDQYDHLRTVVPSGKFGANVGEYIRGACGGVVLKATKPGKTGQGQGGSLYIPEGGMESWGKYCEALAQSGSEATIFEVPAMSCEQTASAIGAALNSEVEYELGKIEGEIAAAAIGEKALKGRQGDLEDLKSKLDEYAGMLGGLSDSIRSRIEDVDEAVNDAIIATVAADGAGELFDGPAPATRGIVDTSADLFE